MSRKVILLAAIVALVLAAAVPALASSRSHNHSAKGNPGKGNSGHNKDFKGLVDIGGRKIYMECRSKGRPTVVFVAGAQDRAETWSTTQNPSKKAVLPAIAQTNRVCAYDRPGTLLATGDGPEDFEKSRSDPVDQPTTLQDHVDDLHALLKASGEGKRPYVVVGHSMGGAVSRLYATQYPEEVSGLVLVDPTPHEAANLITPRQWRLWKPLLGGPPSKEALKLYPALEWSDNDKNRAQASNAKKLQPMPFIAFQSDVPFDFAPFVEDGTLPMTLKQAEQFRILLYNAWHDTIGAWVSQVPGAKFIDDPHSTHYIHQVRPKLVTNAVREVVEAARKKSCALGVKNHGQCVKAEQHAQR